MLALAGAVGRSRPRSCRCSSAAAGCAVDAVAATVWAAGLAAATQAIADALAFSEPDGTVAAARRRRGRRPRRGGLPRAVTS